MALARVRWKRGTAAQWSSDNPVLRLAEPGWETDTNQGKVGDGTSAWNSLPYSLGGGGSSFSGTVTISQISDATTVGKAVLGATTQGNARTAIGAGTASTKTDVGLANVTNTSDANKPVSTAQQAALDLKEDQSALIADVIAGLSGIPQMRFYSSGWPTDANYSSASRSWIFVGGDTSHNPPSIAGGGLWAR